MASIYSRTWMTPAGEQKTAWRVKYWVNGRDRSKQFKSRRAATRFAERLDTVRAAEIKDIVDGKGPTVNEICDRWLAACARGRDGHPPLDPETVVFYRGHVENYIKPQLGSLSLGRLSRADVRGFREGLLETDLSRATCKKILTTLRTAVRFALDEGEIASDPSAGVTVRLSGRARRRVEIPSKEGVAAMLAAADRLAASSNKQVAHTWARYCPLVYLLFYAGLRLSEARGLERDAVDVAMRTVTIRQRADRRGRIGDPKSAQGHRNIHIPDACARRLESWLEAHRHPLVFATAAGRPIDGNNIRKRCWEVVCKEAKVPQLPIHSARHFFASRQIELGADAREVSELLGHADPGFTLRVYGHLFKDRDARKRREQRAEASVLETQS